MNTYSTRSSPYRAKSNVQSHLYKLENYYLKWKIRVHAGNSEAFFFRKSGFRCSKKRNLPNLEMNGEKIEYKKSVRYLGYHVQPNLKHNDHDSRMLLKAHSGLHRLYPIMKVGNGISQLVKVKTKPLRRQNRPTGKNSGNSAENRGKFWTQNSLAKLNNFPPIKSEEQKKKVHAFSSKIPSKMEEISAPKNLMTGGVFSKFIISSVKSLLPKNPSKMSQNERIRVFGEFFDQNRGTGNNVENRGNSPNSPPSERLSFNGQFLFPGVNIYR